MSATQPIDKQPFSGLQLSPQDVAALVEGVDFSSPVHEGETSLLRVASQAVLDIVENVNLQPNQPTFRVDDVDLSPCCPTVTVCGLPHNFYDLFCQYHILLARGCRTCSLCADVLQRMNWLDSECLDCSADVLREIPDSLSFERYRFISSDDFWSRWCRQPRDEFEEWLFAKEYETAIVYDEIQTEYWAAAEQEIQYLMAWEQTYRVDDNVRPRKRKLPYSFKANSSLNKFVRF